MRRQYQLSKIGKEKRKSGSFRLCGRAGSRSRQHRYHAQPRQAESSPAPDCCTTRDGFPPTHLLIKTASGSMRQINPNRRYWLALWPRNKKAPTGGAGTCGSRGVEA